MLGYRSVVQALHQTGPTCRSILLAYGIERMASRINQGQSKGQVSRLVPLRSTAEGTMLADILGQLK